MQNHRPPFITPHPNDTKNVSKNSLYHAISKLCKIETKRLDIKKQDRAIPCPVHECTSSLFELNDVGCC